MLGFAERTSGALTMRDICNFTSLLLNEAIRNADGWYRNARGVYNNLNKQTGIGTGSHQHGVKTAVEKVKIVKRIGKICFGVSIAISSAEVGLAYYNNDANKKEVALKASIDVFMGAVGIFGEPIGWVISGTYFIHDLTGGFGDFGKSTGMTKLQIDTFNQQGSKPVKRLMGEPSKKLDFEIDYSPASNENDFCLYLQKKDYTIVAHPKTIFYKL